MDNLSFKSKQPSLRIHNMLQFLVCMNFKLRQLLHKEMVLKLVKESLTV